MILERGAAPSGTGSETSRRLELDGVRGVAILLILVHHYLKGIDSGDAFDRLLHRISEAGWIGVDLFFVLSGYLITSILIELRETSGSLRSFYVRRALRILPPYYLLLLLLLVVGPALGVSIVGDSTRDGIWFWLFGSNFLTAIEGWPHRVLTPLWSLAVEEHFYLVWPLVVLAAPRRLFPWVTAGVAGMSVLLRAVVAAWGGSESALYVLTFTRLDALALGGLVAALMQPDATAAPRVARVGGLMSFVAAGAGVAALSTGRGHWGSWSAPGATFGYFVLAAGMAGFLAWLLNGPRFTPLHRILRSAPLTYIGRRSYAMYLYHMVLIEVAARLGFAPESAATPGLARWPFFGAHAFVQSCLLLVVAEASFRWFERPLLQLKRHFPYGAYRPGFEPRGT